MPYQFATERPDYSDLASGRVLYSLPGHPAFPIRLGSEILQRCLALRAAPLRVLYDPCCGTGYLVTVLGYLHAESLGALIASDVDEKAVALARRNLDLLRPDGLARRTAELAALGLQYGKESHQQALVSAQVLRARVESLAARPLPTRVFTANALDQRALLEHLPQASVDLVLTDVPYGGHSRWVAAPGADPLAALLSALRGVMAPGGMLALISDKAQKVPRTDPLGVPKEACWRRLDHFQMGKRKIEILGL